MLDIAPETAVQRKAVDRDRYERDLAMQAACARATTGRRRQQDWVVLDGERPKDAIAADVFSAVHVTTRAAVSARTSRAPPSFSTRAHASSVAPVVLTSSTSTTIAPDERSQPLARRRERVRARCDDAAPPGRSGLRRVVAELGAARRRPAGRRAARDRRPD